MVVVFADVCFQENATGVLDTRHEKVSSPCDIPPDTLGLIISTSR